MINITYQSNKPAVTLRFEEKKLPFFAFIRGGSLAFISTEKSEKGYRAHFLDTGGGVYVDLEEQIHIVDHNLIIHTT